MWKYCDGQAIEGIVGANWKYEGAIRIEILALNIASLPIRASQNFTWKTLTGFPSDKTDKSQSQGY